ncbi:hypothetical protein Tco_0561427 [Tanacetum coccineum]
MTDATSPLVILLLDKLMTITNLTTLIPVKLDIDEMNYSSLMYFLKNPCRGHEILKHIMGEPTGEATSNNQSLPTAEWLVFKDPQTAKEAWDLIAKIFNDNKHTCSIALKAELLSLKLCDLSNDAYFCKIESIATILTSLGSPISNDDVVNIALEGFLDRYENVSSIIIHQDPFPDLKTVRSMLTTEDMWLNSRTILVTYVFVS